MLSYVYLLILLQILFESEVTCNVSPIVTTKSGPLQGSEVQVLLSPTELPIAVYKFLGIPFAEPPVGQLRYRKTRPVQQWTDILNAVKMPSPCVQLEMSGGPVGNEDCLYLNIWVPKATLDEPDKKSTSAFVFIHGGAFQSGSISDSMFDGSFLSAANNIIVVTIQYRLGSLGFGYLGNDEVPGNMGLWDQLEALKWISENVGYFGGTNQEITIGGESAGAMSVSWHLLSRNSRRYFQKAIIQSGAAISPWGRNGPDVALAVTNMVFQQFCSQTSLLEKMQCLRSVDAMKIPEADRMPESKIYEHILHPVTSGDFLPNDPVVMFRNGDFHKVPLLIGANRDEGSIFVAFSDIVASRLRAIGGNVDRLTSEDYSLFMNDRFKQLGGEKHFPTSPNQLLIDTVKYQYWPQSHEGWPKGGEVFKAVSDAHGEMGMTCPSFVWANVTAANGVANVFVYHLTQVLNATTTPPYMGVIHSADLQFMFGQPFGSSPLSPNYTEEEKQFSRAMMTYWGNFVKYGDPNGAAENRRVLARWPPYSGTECLQQYFELNVRTVLEKSPAVVCGLKERNCLFWQDHMPILIDKLTPANPKPSRASSHNEQPYVIGIQVAAMLTVVHQLI